MNSARVISPGVLQFRSQATVSGHIPASDCEERTESRDASKHSGQLSENTRIASKVGRRRSRTHRERSRAARTHLHAAEEVHETVLKHEVGLLGVGVLGKELVQLGLVAETAERALALQDGALVRSVVLGQSIRGRLRERGRCDAGREECEGSAGWKRPLPAGCRQSATRMSAR